MELTFYGVRGSRATPGKDTVEYGGNTTCIEVVAGSDRYVFDAGTGIIDFGRKLAGIKERTKIFMTHFHADHIQGFPFFTPAYIPGREIDVYGKNGNIQDIFEKDRQQTATSSPFAIDDVVTNHSGFTNGVKRPFAAQQNVDTGVFPIGLNEFKSNISFKVIGDKRLGFNESRIESRVHNAHPQGMMAYKVFHGDKTLVFSGDYESDKKRNAGQTDAMMVDWMRNADVAILDGQYTPQEYLERVGWGHTDYRRVVQLATEAKVKKLFVTHHDPTHNDTQLHEFEADAQAFAKTLGGVEVAFAKESVLHNI